MPLYEYSCPGCGTTFEKRVSFSQADEIDCPECGEHSQRQVSRIAAVTGGKQIGISSAPAPAVGGG